jgi:hypothetical protein
VHVGPGVDIEEGVDGQYDYLSKIIHLRTYFIKKVVTLDLSKGEITKESGPIGFRAPRHVFAHELCHASQHMAFGEERTLHDHILEEGKAEFLASWLNDGMNPRPIVGVDKSAMLKPFLANYNARQIIDLGIMSLGSDAINELTINNDIAFNEGVTKGTGVDRDDWKYVVGYDIVSNLASENELDAFDICRVPLESLREMAFESVGRRLAVTK